MNNAAPDLSAFVGLPSQTGGGTLYPVILGKAVSRKEAQARLEEASRLGFVARSDPYLSRAE